MNKEDKLKLSRETCDKLKYYVYILIDKNTNEPFYVGKGKGNRINRHFIEAMDKDSYETEKLKKIRNLKNNVKKIVLRHKLNQDEAFNVEAAIIDYIGLNNLCNKVAGHHRSNGINDLEELKIKYEAEDAIFKESALLININQLYSRGMTNDEIYEAVRKYWKINLNRAGQIRLVCAVSQGIIRGVFNQREWKISTSPEHKNRAYFIKDEISNKEINKYLNKSVRRYRQQGAANPIRYV